MVALYGLCRVAALLLLFLPSRGRSLGLEAVQRDEDDLLEGPFFSSKGVNCVSHVFTAKGSGGKHKLCYDYGMLNGLLLCHVSSHEILPSD